MATTLKFVPVAAVGPLDAGALDGRDMHLGRAGFVGVHLGDHRFLAGQA